MASLTKIMTAITSIEIACELKINIHKVWFIVSKYASTMIGTTAGLVEQQRVTIFDLLHGLMLPSGNDAAMTLAENFSERLRDVLKEVIAKI
jgi:D-alanyl-D-alanine carboxypeptidase